MPFFIRENTSPDYSNIVGEVVELSSDEETPTEDSKTALDAAWRNADPLYRGVPFGGTSEDDKSNRGLFE